jgi:hypothetical protein
MSKGTMTVIAFAIAIPLFIVVILSGGPDCTTGSAAGAQAAVAALPTEEVENLPGLSADADQRTEQLSNAVAVINAADDADLPLKAQVIGVMTALGESSLLNLDHGDEGDGVTNPDGSPTCSLGVFQQQWCLGWGTREQVMDPAYAAGKFYDALAKVDGWQNLPPTIAAHRVQHNANPWHYEPYWDAASAIVSALTGVALEAGPTVAAGQCAYAAAAGNGQPGDGPGAWGGYSNGGIPPEALKAIPWAPGHLLRPDAADALIALNNQYLSEFGTNLTITDTYRSLAEQYAVKEDKGDLAATPGYSNHGWGLAIDVGGMGAHNTTTYRWMTANGPRYGWSNPAWAQAGGSKPEAWHWEYAGGSNEA